MKRPKILLVDDHAFISELLGMRLESEPFLEILTAVRNADQAITQARLHHPDLIITDIEMPGLSIFDALQTIKAELPNIGIIFLTAHTSDCNIQRALDLEARAYLLKEEPLENLVQIIKKTAQGKRYFSPNIQARLVVTTGGLRLGNSPASRGELLTDREQQVLDYIARGLSKKEMAELMTISIKTVDNHCSHLMTKLDIHDRVRLARYAIQQGFSRL